MSNKSVNKKKLVKGVTGNYSGKIEGIVFQKNGTIRKCKNTPKRPRK